MAGWFDSYAKNSAQRSDSVKVGRTAQVSRRRLIVGGSAAVGAAWTAPILMASSAAAVGASACSSPNTFCTNGNPATAECCPSGSTCNPTGGIGGVPSCENEVGGLCHNSGTGSCRVNSVHCNGNANSPKTCNYCVKSPICGGEGAVCTTDADCANEPGLNPPFLQTCSSANTPAGSTAKFCRRQCTSNAGCNNGQFCDTTTHFCVASCTKDSDCMSPGACVNSICLYTASV
jgi:hypothetical protein